MNVYQRQCVRLGFTLTEMLVAMGILALLVGISLPAVQAVRERARATVCQNNLRQIWLGVASYELSHGHLPTPVFRNRGIRDIIYSNFVEIFPFVERQHVFDQLDYSGELAEILLLQSAKPEIYSCPTDIVEHSRVSYLFSVGPNWLLVDEGSGIFALSGGRSPSLSSISDGLSNTIGLSECAEGTRSNRVRGLYAFAHEQMTVSRFDELLRLAPATTVDKIMGTSWTTFGWGFSQYSHYLPPGNHSGTLGSFRGAYTPSSNHRQLIHSVRADGSVTSIKYSIDRVLWVQLGDRSDGGRNHFE